MRFSGRDVNIHEVWNAYNNVYQQWNNRTKEVIEADELMKMFLRALRELKYLGFLQGTRQSTFIFRRNYFGKAGSKD